MSFSLMSYILIDKTQCNKIPQFLNIHHSLFSNGKNEIPTPTESMSGSIQHASVIEVYDGLPWLHVGIFHLRLSEIMDFILSPVVR